MSTTRTLLALAALAPAVFSAPLASRQAPSGVPAYVLTYAPIVYLDSSDPYFPSDIGAQLSHTQPEVNFATVSGAPNPLTLNNLNTLNNLGGTNVYLTSKDDISKNPSWLNGVKPDASGKTNGAVSCAIIVNDHGSGLVDAFYMYFYAFNYGGDYFSFIIGDHVGDWEHNMIRFQNGMPQAIWYSQHANGEAFTYATVQKSGVRPIVFSANGSHANYAITGTHDHTIPNVNLPEGPVEDHTDKGSMWDPTLSAYYYSYNAGSNTFAAYDSSTPVNWLYFNGHWGDQQYPNSDPRQTTIFGISGTQKYQGGPTGPEDKQLNRTNVCPDNGDTCIVRTILGP
ncbi:hypothetical protein LTR78_005817 [Recurvomyces mirabilis]|uniref:Vacuolar protein sorting-associated protein 62 n=1 Tax=Recurvomyces mirabilis TaxID=574656 RepID=A0AAE1C100_9PEZI|nr:hypothetical protein LTR78_005817 [Recurvomyces mirabilis]KAK5154197.1 hypothetical protein LTS14_006882 [Recurvomyces mirabilis]